MRISEELKQRDTFNQTRHIRQCVFDGFVVILPPVPGPEGPDDTAAASSPDLCRKLAGKFHEGLFGLTGSCDVPGNIIQTKRHVKPMTLKGKRKLLSCKLNE